MESASQSKPVWSAARSPASATIAGMTIEAAMAAAIFREVAAETTVS